MDNIIERLLGNKKKIIKKASQSDTWCGGDFDYELDQYLVAYANEEDGVVFIYQFVNALEHSMDSYYNYETLKCGYYNKDGAPVAANVYFYFSDEDEDISFGLGDFRKVNKGDFVVFNKPVIGSGVPSLIGTYEKDGNIYSGKFKDGKLHGFGFVAKRTQDGIKLEQVGIFENGRLLEKGPASFYAVSNLNTGHLNGYTFSSFLKAKESLEKECYFKPEEIAEAFR